MILGMGNVEGVAQEENGVALVLLMRERSQTRTAI